MTEVTHLEKSRGEYVITLFYLHLSFNIHDKPGSHPLKF
jgi:hypothetical protein